MEYSKGVVDISFWDQLDGCVDFAEWVMVILPENHTGFAITVEGSSVSEDK